MSRWTKDDVSFKRFNMTASPCPFCASDNVAVRIERRPHAQCMDCAAEGPPAECPEDAATRWNFRPSRPAPQPTFAPFPWDDSRYAE